MKLQSILPPLIYEQLPAGWSREQLANFLGQCDHESNGFKTFNENLNYSGEALWTLFHTHFADADEANTFARQPKRIANRVYANRMGNGDEASGDGWLYRGAGAIQLTGKTNHEAFLKSIGAAADSDIAVEYPLASAIWYWNRHEIDKIAIAVDSHTIERITRIINGGVNGLPNRIARTKFYYSQLQA